MKIRFRFSWSILLVLLAALLASFFTQLYQSNRQMQALRDTFAQSELLVSRSVLFTLTDAIGENDWSLVFREIASLQQATRSTRLLLLDGDGKIIADSHTGAAGGALPGALIAEALESGQALRWKPGEDVLQIFIKTNLMNDRGVEILGREVAMQPELVQVRSIQFESMLRSFLLTLVLCLAGAGAMWVLSVQPLKRMHETATAVSQGDLQQRVEPTSLAELNDLGTAFNQMLDRVEEQRRELEMMNRGLEQTVTERTLEIERASRGLAKRAAGIEMINRILNSASSSVNMRELAEAALRHLLHSMQADYGWIAIEGTVIAACYPDAMSSYVNAMAKEVNSQYDVRLLVDDWLSLSLPPEQEAFSEPLLRGEIRTTASVTILAGSKAIGRIDLASKTPHQWEDDDLNLMEIAGQQLGVAIQRLQDYEESLENSRMMTRLAGLASLLNQPLTVDEVTATIGKGLIDLSGAPRAAIFQKDPLGKINPLWTHNLPRRLVKALVSRTKAESNFFLPANPMPDFVSSTTQLGDEKAEWWQMAGAGIQAYASWPLISEGETTAAMVCFHDRPIVYNQIQKGALEAFSRQAATALRNARLLESEREQRSLAEALGDVTSALTSTLDFDEVIERILTNLNRVVEHDGANVMMLDGDMLYIVRTRGQSLPVSQVKEWRNPLSLFKVMQRAQRIGKAVVVPDTDHEPDWVYRRESDWIKSYATAPVRSRGKIIGFVNVSSKQAGFYTEKHGELLQAFADQASVAMENARQFQMTRAQADETNQLLRALAPLFTAGGDLATVTEAIARAVVREFQQAHCSVLLVDRERERLNLIREAGDFSLGRYSLPLDGPGLTVAAVNSGEIIYAPDVSVDKRYVNAESNVRSELVIPLIAGGEVIGALNLESFAPDAFNEQAQRILSIFAEQAAWVVENARLFDETRTGVRRMILLNEITQVALSGGDARQGLKEIIQRVAALIDADGAYMTAWHEDTRQTIPLMAYGPNAEVYTEDIPEPGEENLTSALMREGVPIAVENVLESALIPSQLAERFPIRALLGVPLQVENHKLGAILVGFEQPHHFTRSERTVVQQAAGQIALILARLSALEEAEKRAQDSERLRKAGTALTTTLDVAEVAQLIIQHMASLVSFDSAIVLLYTEKGIKPIAQRNIPAGDELLDMCFPFDDPLQLDMMANEHPLLLVDAQTDPRFMNWGGTYQVHSWMGLMLRSANQAVGSVNLGRFEVKPFQEDEVLLAQVYSNQAGTALQNAVLHERQQQLAITDPLTGLYNRRGFMELAQHELERSRRFNRPLTVLMLDIDLFKDVNDRYGHPVGDEVLKELAQRFKLVLREVDLIGRYGGEEFCILLPESECIERCSAAERIIEVVRSTPFHAGGADIWITVSIGVSTLTSNLDSLEELIAQTDQAMYQAKRNGRDRVEYWGKPVD